MNPFTHSPELDKLAPALAQFQLENLVVVEEGTNKQLSNSRYAYLSDILIQIRPKLAECELSVSQFVGNVTKTDDVLAVGVTTILLHKSGQFMAHAGQWMVPEPIIGRQSGSSAVNSAQRHGSAFTYARRYSLLAVLGMATGDDDDAQKAGMVGRSDDHDIMKLTDDATWQDMFKSEAWRTFPSDSHPGFTLGDLKRSEITPLIRENAVNGGANPAITAASAAMLKSSAKQRGFRIVEALEAAKWTGPTEMADFTAQDILAAITAISSLPINQQIDEDAPKL